MLEHIDPSMLEGEAPPALLVTFTGPSCCGKTTLVQKMIKDRPQIMQYIRSLATRQPRTPDEKDIYRFISTDEFLGMRSRNEVLQEVFFKDNWYGSHRDQIFKDCSGKIAIAIVEPSGVAAYRAISKHFHIPYVSVYLDAERNDLICRWVERRETQRRTTGQVDEAYYLGRMKEVDEELKWKQAEKYSFYLPASNESSFALVQAQVELFLALSVDAAQAGAVELEGVQVGIDMEEPGTDTGVTIIANLSGERVDGQLYHHAGGPMITVDADGNRSVMNVQPFVSMTTLIKD